MEEKLLQSNLLQTHYVEISQHDKKKRVRVLLPSNYGQTDQEYSVLYMLDGQNIFFDSESYGGSSWRVYQGIQELGLDNLIIAAVDNAGPDRMKEYGPWLGDAHNEFAQMGGQGVEFGSWFVNKLIPTINEIYPIKRGPQACGIAGSSMGAIMTVFMGHEYPDVFGKLGVFSLASFFNSQAQADHVQAYPINSQTQVCIQVGTLEGDSMSNHEINPQLSQAYIDASLNYYNQLLAAKHPLKNIQMGIYVGHKHHEYYWSQQFIDCLKFFYT